MLPEQEEMVLRVLKDCGIEPSIKPFKSVLDGGIINDQGNEIYAKELPLCLVDDGFTINTEYEYEGKPRVISPSIPMSKHIGDPSRAYGYIPEGSLNC